MKNKMKSPVPAWMVLAGLTIALLAALPMARAQGAAAVPPSRFLGTITAIAGDTLTVKSDADGVRQVEVPAAAAIKRIAPGEKDLSTAAAIQFSDLAVGDRVLVKLDPNAPAGVSQALQIIAIKQEDVALKQQKDREDWQRRGVGGLVKSVDSAGGVIVLTSGRGRHGQDHHRSHHQGNRAQALRARIGELRCGAIGADRRHSRGRPVAGARNERMRTARRWPRKR
jgi:hypothetical protein